MLTGAGGNIGISAGKDGVLMIDASYAPLSEKIKAAIRTFNSKPIRFVVTTHCTRMHAGGNEILPEKERFKWLMKMSVNGLDSEQFLELFDRKIPDMPESSLPIITFSSDISFHLKRRRTS